MIETRRGGRQAAKRTLFLMGAASFVLALALPPRAHFVAAREILLVNRSALGRRPTMSSLMHDH